MTTKNLFLATFALVVVSAACGCSSTVVYAHAPVKGAPGVTAQVPVLDAVAGLGYENFRLTEHSAKNPAKVGCGEDVADAFLGKGISPKSHALVTVSICCDNANGPLVCEAHENGN